MFAGWGRIVYRYRWATLIGSGVLLAISIVGLLMGGTLTSGGPLTSNLESARAGNLMSSELASSHKQTSTFMLIFRSDSLSVSDPAFKDAVTSALAPIQNDPRINSLTDPYNAPSPRAAQAFTSNDGHEALVSVELKSSGTQAWKDYDALRGQVHSDSLTVTGTGFEGPLTTVTGRCAAMGTLPNNTDKKATTKDVLTMRFLQGFVVEKERTTSIPERRQRQMKVR